MYFSRRANSGPIFFVLSLGLWCSLLQISVGEVTLQQLEVAVAETATKLETDTLTWTTEIEIPGSRLLGHVVAFRSPTMRRYDVSLKDGQKIHFGVGIVERDGIWYVAENDRLFRCRPYEAVLHFPSVYYLLERSELRFSDASSWLDRKARVESAKEGVAVLRAELEPARLKQFQAAIENAADLLARTLDAGTRRKVADRIANLRETVDNGVRWSVNVETGVVVEDGGLEAAGVVTDIAWVLPPLDKIFDVSGGAWEDRTQPIAAGEADRDDLIMIEHAPAWTPTHGKKGDSSTVLLNIKTGRMARVPYRGAACMPGSGSFSPDRTKVYVVGIVWDEGQSTAFEIDLLSGRQRRVSMPSRAGHIMSTALSPDGKTLAVAHLPGTGRGRQMLQSQIYLIDIDSGAERPLGKPLDTAFLSWLPNGEGMTMVSRETIAPDKPPKSTIIRVDLDGQLTPLLPGVFPYVLADGDRMLFRDQETDLWHTCDLNGRQARLVGDGLPGHGFPAVSPRDSHAIFMKYGGDKGPRPHLVDLNSGVSEPLAVPDGLWLMPAWR